MIYILLPVHNRKEITRGFMECLKAQTCTDFQLILIDDGSSDGSAEMVKEYIPSATVLRGRGDWWWAGSLQQGLNWLEKENVHDDDIVLFINDDVGISNEYLENAVRVMADKQGVLVLSRYHSPTSGAITESGISADLRRLTFNVAESAGQINCLSTRGLFVHWADVKRIGGFHPRLLPHYLSDYEYTIRAHHKGLNCETNAELLIVPNNETTGYHIVTHRNFGEFLKKFFSIKSPGNPVYWSIFIMLAAHPVWKIPLLLRLWAGACNTILKALIMDSK